MNTYGKFLESLRYNCDKKNVSLRNFWNVNFLILSAGAIAACGGGGGDSDSGGSGSGGNIPQPRNMITLNPASANTGTARADIFISDGMPPRAGFSINGGADIDELRLSGADAATVDLTDLLTDIDSVEIINTVGGGNTTVQLNAATVTAFSTLSTRDTFSTANLQLLILRGDSTETVNLEGDWTIFTQIGGIVGSHGILTYDGVDYNLFTNGTALVAIVERHTVMENAETVSPTTLANPDVVLNDTQANLIFGSDRIDRLEGGGGNEFIYGGNGDDMMITGDGSFNYLFGGQGRDTFGFNNDTANADDFILDFEPRRDRFAVDSRTVFETRLEDLIAGNAALLGNPDQDQIDSFVSNFFADNSAADIFKIYFDSGAYAFTLENETAIDGTSVQALKRETTAGMYRLNLTIGGQDVMTPNIGFTAVEVTVIPTADFSNLAALQDGITFEEFVAALGGESAFVLL